MKFTPNRSINNEVTISIDKLLYAAILAFFTENPPVPAVANAVVTLSKSGISQQRSVTISATVKAPYIM